MDSTTNNFQHLTKKQFIATLLVWLAAVLLFFAPSIIGGKIIAPLDCLECLFRPVANMTALGLIIAIFKQKKKN